MPDESRRPLEDWERPYLLALASALRELRREAGVTQADIAWSTMFSSYERVERATRRTRESTLRRIVDFMVGECPTLGEVDAIVARLVAVAGPSLAPESPYRARIEKRRARRARQRQRDIALFRPRYFNPQGDQ